MEINNYSFTSDLGNNFLSILKSEDAVYDNIAERIMRSDKPYFLAGVSEVNINGEMFYKYDLGNYIPLDQVNMKLKKKEAVTLLKNLLVPLTICRDWLLDSHSIIFDSKFIMMNMHTFEIKYIYMFDKGNMSTDEEIVALFTEIVRNIDIIDDPILLNEFMRYVLRGNFSIGGLLEIVERHSDDKQIPVNNTPERNRQPASPVHKQHSPINDNNAKKAEPAVKKEEPAASAQASGSNPFGVDAGNDNAAVNPFGDSGAAAQSSGKNFFDMLKKKNKPAEKPPKKEKKKEPIMNRFLSSPNKQNDAVNVNYSDETQFADAMGDATMMVDACLELVAKTGPLSAPASIDVSVSNGEMTIGRKSDNGRNDFDFPADFKKISRHHAKITFDGCNYYICDLDTINKTYVNGSAIAPNNAVYLNNGDRIVFGDKDYTYEFKRK